MLVQVILIVAVMMALLYFLGNRNTTQLRAGKKVLFVLFVVAAIVSILAPDALTWLAHLVGVGRGADLLLYGLVVAFVYVSLNIYFKFKELAQRQARVVRAMALLEERLNKATGPDEQAK
ncbi:MAG TPA: DUF2304 domain-containing protein [Candidatus Saccharimonas sp.]|nr:DUF2304 domain-containing protein [Candidatus Saccharimonas sp.]